MDPVVAIHTAARRHCLRRIALWQQAFADLARRGRHEEARPDGTRAYTQEAVHVFPRANAARALLSEIESFAPDDFGDEYEAREMLALAADAARDRAIRFNDVREVSTVDSELALYARFVWTLHPATMGPVAPLPYRRVLKADEARALREQAERRWGCWHDGEPDRSGLPPYLTRPASPFGPSGSAASEQGRGERGGAYARLREIIGPLLVGGTTGTASGRVWEFREWGDSLEVDLAWVNFAYDGAEVFVTAGRTAEEMDWMVYAWREDTITVGGERLVEQVRRAWPG